MSTEPKDPSLTADKAEIDALNKFIKEVPQADYVFDSERGSNISEICRKQPDGHQRYVKFMLSLVNRMLTFSFFF